MRAVARRACRQRAVATGPVATPPCRPSRPVAHPPCRHPPQEANRLLILPSLAGGEAWASLPPTAQARVSARQLGVRRVGGNAAVCRKRLPRAPPQVFTACGWTVCAVTVGLLPVARSISERIGFVGGAAGCPDPGALALAAARLAGVYALLICAGLGASAAAGERRPCGGMWAALPGAPPLPPRTRG